MFASKIASQVSRRSIRSITVKRLQSSSTSTMALYGNTPCVERTTTLSDIHPSSASEKKIDFSTCTSSSYDCEDIREIVSHHTLPVVGVEISPEQAAANARPGSYFDKIMIFISHGETSEGMHVSDVNASLTGKVSEKDKRNQED